MSQVSTNLMSLHSPLQFDIHPFDFSFINVFWMCWWDVFTRFLYLSPGRLLVLLGEDDLHIDREEVWMVWIGATNYLQRPFHLLKTVNMPQDSPGSADLPRAQPAVVFTPALATVLALCVQTKSFYQPKQWFWLEIRRHNRHNVKTFSQKQETG